MVCSMSFRGQVHIHPRVVWCWYRPFGAYFGMSSAVSTLEKVVAAYFGLFSVVSTLAKVDGSVYKTATKCTYTA